MYVQYIHMYICTLLYSALRVAPSAVRRTGRRDGRDHESKPTIACNGGHACTTYIYYTRATGAACDCVCVSVSMYAAPACRSQSTVVPSPTGSWRLNAGTYILYSMYLAPAREIHSTRVDASHSDPTRRAQLQWKQKCSIWFDYVYSALLCSGSIHGGKYHEWA